MPKSISNIRLHKRPERVLFSYDVCDGDTILGKVSPVIASLNRPTGTWSYRIGDEIVWHAGHSAREAAMKMVKKL